MSDESDIRSESRFLWSLLLELLKLPFILILIIFRKRDLKELLVPLVEIWKFIVEAKFTFFMILLNTLIFFISIFFFSDALVNSLINAPSDILSSKFYTIITAGFLHAGIPHLGWNMLALFIFGRAVEQKLGSAKTAGVYFGALVISGVFTDLVHLFIMQDNTPGLGASGAIMGLVAAAILVHPFYITYELIVPLPIMVAGWLAIWSDITGIINPVEDGIGHLAHLGGFISVAVTMWLIGVEDRQKMLKGLMINAIILALAALLWFLLLKNHF